MYDLRKNISKRLKEVREKVFMNGVKLSTAQFAQLLNLSESKLRNYELGRSNIPVELIVKLYHKGINPIYLLTGEASVFADNSAGEQLSRRVNQPINSANSSQYLVHENQENYKSEKNFDPSGLSDEEKLSLITAVAGDLLAKKKSEQDK